MWHPIPAFKLIIPLILGILFGINIQIPILFTQILFFISLLIISIFIFYRKLGTSFKYHFYFGGFIQITIFASGSYLTFLNNPTTDKNYFDNYMQESSVLEVRILEPVEKKTKSTKLLVEVIQVVNDSLAFPTTGKAILYFALDSASKEPFQYGEVFYIKNKLKQPNSQSNPNEFNYGKYLQMQGIYYQGYFKESDFIKGNEIHKNFIWDIVFKTRAYFEQSLAKYIKDPNALSVGSALLIGSKTKIDEDIKNAYAHTGTMHILAVSGLHVGILYFILEWIFNLIFKGKSFKTKYRLFTPLCILLIIWFYAFVTGLSPSVSRSAVMFSFLVFGKIYNRKFNSFNILAASAIPLLVFNPFMIMQVGFQLSYIAILGIVTFQPKISKLYIPRNQISKYIWSLITVSIAAQIGTVPITLFYFHQFPNYFLLSNILAIPISFLVLLFGIFFFIFSAIPFVSFILGFLLELSIKILNFSVGYIDQFPFAVTENIYLNLWEVLVFSLFLFLFGFFLYFKTKQLFYFSLASIFILFSSVSIRKIKNYNSDEFILYNLNKSFALAINSKNTSSIYCRDTLSEESDDFKYHMKEDLLANSIDVFNFNLIDSGKPIFSLGGFNFLSIDSNFDLPFEIKNFEIDYILISNSPFLQLEQLCNLFPDAIFVLDKSNGFKSKNYYTKYFVEHGVRFYDLSKSSGFVIPQEREKI